MTLTEYGKILDRVIPFEAGFICADSKYVYLYKRKPSLERVTRKTLRWVGAGGQLPLLIMRLPSYFLDLEEYKDKSGVVDYTLVVEAI